MKVLGFNFQLETTNNKSTNKVSYPLAEASKLRQFMSKPTIETTAIVLNADEYGEFFVFVDKGRGALSKRKDALTPEFIQFLQKNKSKIEELINIPFDLPK